MTKPVAFEEAILTKQTQFGQYGMTEEELALVPAESRGLFVKLGMQVAALMNQNEKLAQYVDRVAARRQANDDAAGKPKIILPGQ